MDSFIVKKSSWHYKIIQSHIKYTIPYMLKRDQHLYTTECLKDKVHNDFCSYFRNVMIYLAKFLVIYGMTLWVLFVNTIGWSFYALGTDPLGINFGFFFPMVIGALSCLFMKYALIFAIGILVMSLFVYGIKELLSSMKGDQPEREQKTSIISTKYKSMKNKFCPAIDFED